MWTIHRYVCMECPRCGGRLETYALDGEEAVGCDSCGYVGVEVEHEREPLNFESWDDALERFYQKHEAAAEE